MKIPPSSAVLPSLLALLLAGGCISDFTEDSPKTTAPQEKAPAREKLPPVAPEILRKIEAGMVTIPAGTLAAAWRSHEAISSGKKDPAVPIARFRLAKTEVTQELWTAVMGTNPSQDVGDDKPVTDVSWLDAQQFIARLNEAMGGAVFRLPTSAEWEYACRSGQNGKVSYQASEATLDRYAWWGKNSGERVHPVGQKKPNAWGLHDMLGNVAEWCQNEAEPLAGATMRPIAGANFSDENLVGQDCNPGGAMGQDGADAWTGFRLAMVAPAGHDASTGSASPAPRKKERKP